MVDMHYIDGYLEENLDQSIQELTVLCAQPSVAAQNWGVTECAQLVENMLRKRGFSTKIYPTDARSPSGQK